MNSIVRDQATVSVCFKVRQSRSVSNTVVILSSKMSLVEPLYARFSSVKVMSCWWIQAFEVIVLS